MRTEKEIIEAMLELQHRITLCKSRKLNANNEYYTGMVAKLAALKYAVGIKDTIA